MTMPDLELVVEQSGKMAKTNADLSHELDEEHRHAGNDNQNLAAQWMQVKMLAEIALQLRVMNQMANEARQPELSLLRKDLEGL